MASSFRTFVSTELDELVTPEDAVAEYAKFQAKSLRQAAEKLKDSGLLFDCYNLLALDKKYRTRVGLAQKTAADVLKAAKNNCYEDLKLVVMPSEKGFGDPGMCKTAGHLQAPHFSFDPDVNALQISAVPFEASAWELYDHLRTQPGFCCMSVPQTEGGLLTRSLRVRFETSDHARVALIAIAAVRLKDGFQPQCSLLNPDSALEALVVPPKMASPEQIAKDAELSGRVLRKLDSLLGIPSEVTEELLALEMSQEKKLDLQILYLRRVHHFCFYACEWCNDEWDLSNRCGAVLVRPQPMSDISNTEMKSAGDEWVKTHSSRLENFLSTASLEHPAVPTADDERLQDRLEAVYAEQMTKITPEKFRCNLCNKCFKGPEYVRKHIRKAHDHIQTSAISELCVELATTAYLAEPARLGWPFAGAVAERAAAALKAEGR